MTGTPTGPYLFSATTVEGAPLDMTEEAVPRGSAKAGP